MDTDLVCGMQVDMKQAAKEQLTSEHDGKTYFFCSTECKQQFDANPEKYIEKEEEHPVT